MRVVWRSTNWQVSPFFTQTISVVKGMSRLCAHVHSRGAGGGWRLCLRWAEIHGFG